MKLYILLVTTLIAQTSFSQTNTDTIISRSKLDSLENKIYKLTDSLKRLQYKNWFLENYSRTDISTNSRDSLILNFRSKNEKLIQQTTKYYDSDDSCDYEKIQYFNKLQLPEFVEQWETAKAEINGNIFRRKIYSYERFVYDYKGQVTAWIKFYPAFSRRTVRRVDYHYTLTGTQTFSMSRVPIKMFWD